MTNGKSKTQFIKGKSKFLPFRIARGKFRILAKKHGLKNEQQAFAFLKSSKLPKGIPPNPQDVYSKKNTIANRAHGINTSKEIFF